MLHLRLYGQGKNGGRKVGLKSHLHLFSARQTALNVNTFYEQRGASPKEEKNKRATATR